MVLFRTYKPSPPLSEFVNVFWLYNSYHPPHKMGRVLSDGTMELIINLNDDLIRVYDQNNQDQFQSYNGSLISGPRLNFTVIDTACQSSTIGIHFKIGGALPFIGIPSMELYNEHVPLDSLWGRQANEIREQLLEENTADAKFRILEQFLMKIMTRESVHHPAVLIALRKFQAFPQKWSISSMAEQLGLSQRRFIQVFKEGVGLTPNQYCRVQRLQNVSRFVEEQEVVDWTEVALHFGYYDQAHFINDFRTFSGLSPAKYHSLHGKKQNHVPIYG